jgi:hypothetical protein
MILPERDKWHVAGGGPFLPFDRRFRGEDDALIGAVRRAEPWYSRVRKCSSSAATAIAPSRVA